MIPNSETTPQGKAPDASVGVEAVRPPIEPKNLSVWWALVAVYAPLLLNLVLARAGELAARTPICAAFLAGIVRATVFCPRIRARAGIKGPLVFMIAALRMLLSLIAGLFGYGLGGGGHLFLVGLVRRGPALVKAQLECRRVSALHREH
jgi:hypothetical protein